MVYHTKHRVNLLRFAGISDGVCGTSRDFIGSMLYVFGQLCTLKSLQKVVDLALPPPYVQEAITMTCALDLLKLCLRHWKEALERSVDHL
jgi:hypothetical protein